MRRGMNVSVWIFISSFSSVFLYENKMQMLLNHRNLSTCYRQLSVWQVFWFQCYLQNLRAVKFCHCAFYHLQFLQSPSISISLPTFVTSFVTSLSSLQFLHFSRSFLSRHFSITFRCVGLGVANLWRFVKGSQSATTTQFWCACNAAPQSSLASLSFERNEMSTINYTFSLARFAFVRGSECRWMRRERYWESK